MGSQQPREREYRIIVAGFGGQGVLTLARLLCLSSINEGKQVTYLPSYGTEVRGGTANCHIVISPQEIFSPFVESADTLIIMNQPSFERFANTLKEGGLAALNTSLVDPGDYAQNHNATVLPLRATESAAEMGDVLVANVFMMGAFLEASGLCRLESARQAIRQSLTGPKSHKVDINLEALTAGAAAVGEFTQRS